MRRSAAALLLAFGVMLGAALAPRPALGGAYVPVQLPSVCVKKTADESATSDTTLSNDTHLTYAVAASTTYRYRITAHWYSASAAGGFKFQVTAPSSPTFFQGSLLLITDATAFFSYTLNTVSANIAGESGASNAFGTTIVDGVLINGSNAGNLRLQWAQQTSSGTATVLKKGSTLEVWVMQ